MLPLDLPPPVRPLPDEVEDACMLVDLPPPALPLPDVGEATHATSAQSSDWYGQAQGVGVGGKDDNRSKVGDLGVMQPVLHPHCSPPRKPSPPPPRPTRPPPMPPPTPGPTMRGGRVSGGMGQRTPPSQSATRHGEASPGGSQEELHHFIGPLQPDDIQDDPNERWPIWAQVERAAALSDEIAREQDAHGAGYWRRERSRHRKQRKQLTWESDPPTSSSAASSSTAPVPSSL